jgi:enoyl-CoA hydratase/carnithine racemase
MLEFKVSDRIGQITMRRPSVGNAITGGMVRQFNELLLQAGREADIVTLSGEGPDFTIGRDRSEPKSGAPFDVFSEISSVNQAIAAFPGILIACVRGRAFGFGVGLAMRSDIAIAADDAQFMLDEVAHGIPPMFIMEKMAEHIPAKQALDIVLSGRQFGANDALEMGLVSRVVPSALLDGTVKEFLATLSSRDRSVILTCKRYMNAVRKLPADARSAFALIEQTQFAMKKR